MNNRIDEARLSEFESECNKKNEGTLSTILSERSEKTVFIRFENLDPSLTKTDLRPADIYTFVQWFA